MSYDSNIWSSAPPPVIGPGTQLNGIYQIDHAIGSGGMGDIYKGHAIQTGDLVAIKIIRADMAENEAALALFRKEASILHNLAHEAIIRYYVFSVDPAIRRPYLAMEFVDGAPLSDVLHRGPLSFDEVRALQRRMAAGLQAAHELGVVHRDISPDNVILPGGDVRRAKIIDFGIARAAKIGGETVIGGGFAGKHNYASPEQLGLFGGEVTAKSDIYSMGLVLAAALLGRPMDMDGTQVEVIDKRRSVPDLSAIDQRVRPLIESMLQPRPEDRPDSMAAVAEWPRGAATLMPDVRTETRVTQLGPKPAAAREERRPVAGVLVAVGLLAILAASGGAIVYALDLWPFGGADEELAEGPAVPTLPGETDVPDRAEESPADTPPILPPTGGPPAEAPAGPTDGGPGQPAETDVPPVSHESPPPIEPTPTDTGPPAGPAESPDGQPPVTPVGIPPGDAAPAGTPTQEGPAVAPPGIPGGPGSPDILPPEEAPATEEEPLTRLARVEKYVRDYSAGNCFFMTPLSIRDTGEDISARIEVFGSAVEPVKAFDEAFKQANGFEAQISFRQVTADQCPAVEFMSHTAGEAAAAAPELTLSLFELPPDTPLTGSVRDIDGRHVELLLVSETGAVTNVSSDAAPNGNGLSFTVHPETMRARAATPNLLIALVTREPLGLPSSSLPAGAYFPRVLVAAERSNQEIGVAVKYFKMGG
jgi:serine/threonine-protein kinase